MLTAVISDLHLGMARGLDVLSRPDLRRILLAELEGVDRVVLLGDVIELRDRPLCDALRRARPFFEDLAAGLGDARLVVVPGNHDHHLAAAAFGRRRGRTAESNQLGLEQLVCHGCH